MQWSDPFILRCLTIVSAVIFVMVGASVAKIAVKSNNERWWVVVGTLAVAALIVGGGWQLIALGY